MRDYSIPEIGGTKPCPDCGVAVANQHTIRESALCDGIRNGHITGDRKLRVKLALSGKGTKRLQGL